MLSSSIILLYFIEENLKYLKGQLNELLNPVELSFTNYWLYLREWIFIMELDVMKFIK